MNQITKVGRGTLNFCRAYWNWVNQVADNHKIPEKNLNEMIRKGGFKNEEDAKRAISQTIKTTLVAAPFIALLFFVWNLLPKSESNLRVVQTTSSTVSLPEQSSQNPDSSQANQAKPTNVKQAVASPKAIVAEVTGLVQVRGLDYSREASGRIKESKKEIVVTYNYTEQCGADTPGGIVKNEERATFNLDSKKWTQQVRQLSNCLGNTSQEWVDMSDSSLFSLESKNNETIIKADALDTDGSVLVKDTIVVKYP